MENRKGKTQLINQAFRLIQFHLIIKIEYRKNVLGNKKYHFIGPYNYNIFLW